MALPFSELRVQ